MNEVRTVVQRHMPNKRPLLTFRSAGHWADSGAHASESSAPITKEPGAYFEAPCLGITHAVRGA